MSLVKRHFIATATALLLTAGSAHADETLRPEIGKPLQSAQESAAQQNGKLDTARQIGDAIENFEFESAHQMLDAFVEAGGNFIDTANGYTRGHSEKIIGDFIAHDRARRDRIVIATKFFTNLYNGDPNGGGSGRR